MASIVILFVRWIGEQGVWVAPLAMFVFVARVPKRKRRPAHAAVLYLLAAMSITDVAGWYPGPARVSCIFTSGLLPACVERTADIRHTGDERSWTVAKHRTAAGQGQRGAATEDGTPLRRHQTPTEQAAGSLTVSASAVRLPQRASVGNAYQLLEAVSVTTNHLTPDSGGRIGTPEALRPPDSIGTVTVRCPVCIDDDSACLACEGHRTIEVFWAGSQQEPQKTHVFRVETTPADCLCEHEPIPNNELTRPSGLPCFDCITLLGNLSRQSDKWTLSE